VVEVEARPDRLVITEDGVAMEATALDETTFLLDRADPDTPTVTFAGFDEHRRPGVLYDMVWGLERLPG
jgi:hypothetical protein